MAVSARMWLDDLYADSNRPNCPPILKNDLAKALRWMELERFSDIGEKHYKRWAAGFVCYLCEGKTPPNQSGPLSLTPLFEGYAKYAKEEPPPFVDLDDEIRGVFRRLLSVDDAEIAVSNRPSKGLGFFHSLFGVKSR